MEDRLPEAPKVSECVPCCSTEGYHLILEVTISHCPEEDDEDWRWVVDFEGVIQDAEVDGFPFSCGCDGLNLEVDGTMYVSFDQVQLETLKSVDAAYTEVSHNLIHTERAILSCLRRHGIVRGRYVSIKFHHETHAKGEK